MIESGRGDPGRHPEWRFTLNDFKSADAAMQTCLDAPPATITRMGEAARARVLERHDMDKEAAKLADLFSSRN